MKDGDIQMNSTLEKIHRLKNLSKQNPQQEWDEAREDAIKLLENYERLSQREMDALIPILLIKILETYR